MATTPTRRPHAKRSFVMGLPSAGHPSPIIECINVAGDTRGMLMKHYVQASAEVNLPGIHAVGNVLARAREKPKEAC